MIADEINFGVEEMEKGIMYRIIKKTGPHTEYFHRISRKWKSDDKGCYMGSEQQCYDIVNMYSLKNAKVVKIGL